MRADPGDGAAHRRAAQGRGGHHHPAPARSGRARQRAMPRPGSRARSTPGSTCSPSTARCRRSTIRSSSRRCRSAIDREAIVKELWRGRGIVPNGPIAKGDNHFDASSAAAGLQPQGGARAPQEGRLQGRGDRHRDHRRLHGQRQADVRGHRRHVEGRRRQRQGRGDRVLGARPEEPRQDLQGRVVVGSDLDAERSRRHDVAAARPGRAAGLLAPREVRRARRRGALLASTRSSAARPTRR